MAYFVDKLSAIGHSTGPQHSIPKAR